MSHTLLNCTFIKYQVNYSYHIPVSSSLHLMALIRLPRENVVKLRQCRVTVKFQQYPPVRELFSFTTWLKCCKVTMWMETTFITTKIYCLVTRVNHTWGPQIGIFVQLSFFQDPGYRATLRRHAFWKISSPKLSHVLFVHNKQLIFRLARSRFTSMKL